ncbi:MAG: sigma-70 family RNA polymerase sigma factor [Phycisphaerales bacterium]
MAETEAILLSRFVHSGDAEAFAEIIRRYAGLVYSAALRVLADVDRASDIAQETFLQLAKDAGNVTGSLPGWLHRVATHKAIDQVRRDATRRHREAEYMAAKPQEAAEWREISPYVDEGLNLLDPHLRHILISHFLEGRSTREIARAQGVSQATISRRIESGVELLRAGLRRRGILVAAGALSILLGENAAQAAPPVLLTELGKIALISGSLAATTTGAGTASGLSAAVTSVLATVKSNAVAVAAVVAIGVGSFITYQVTRPPKPASTASVDAGAQSPADVVPSLGFDPSAGAAYADRQSQGAGGDARMIASAGQADPSVGQMPRNPAFQGLPGPEAETDPRTYVPGLAGSPGGETLLVSPTPQEDTSDQPSPVVAVDSREVPPEPVSKQATEQESRQIKESPYEMVMRLRREAVAGKSEAPTGADPSAMVSVGPVLAKAELKLVPPFQFCPASTLGFQRQDTTVTKPQGVLETPPDAPHEPVYFAVRVGDGQIQGITYRSIRPPGEIVLYLDTDGDGLWSDEKAYVGRRLWMFALQATFEFGPVYLKQGSTKPGGDAFYPQCSDGKWLTFYPAFYRDGTILLEGQTRRITLVDTDFDGRFNEMFEPPAQGSRDPNCDVISIDCDRFEDMPGGGRQSIAVTIPLSKVIHLDGRYYGVEVAEDGSTIEFRQAEPAFGMLDFGGKEVAAEFWSDAGPQEVNGVMPTWRLPAGKYYLRSLNLTETERGNRWMFKMTKPGELDDFEIKPGRTTSLKIGPPFQARGMFRRFAYNPDVQVRVDLEGQAGERYSAIVKKNDQKVPEPSFKLLDGAQQVVLSGQLADS